MVAMILIAATFARKNKGLHSALVSFVDLNYYSYSSIDSLLLALA